MPGERQGNRTCPFGRGEVVPKDVAFSEGAIPYWERMEISVSQLDRRYDLLGRKIPVVYEHLLMNLLRMIRLNGTTQIGLKGLMLDFMRRKLSCIACSTTFVRPKRASRKI